ncbi:hypothetical protein BKA65DRAFT_71721 [Rhexocercosporidium sp. MPI-PUGE-AT-0058]|nr:hypothetical protein BKA65DRAFT_71721 [Rhexocercosporidium sp. MPI-PUGE-AT-0058]
MNSNLVLSPSASGCISKATRRLAGNLTDMKAFTQESPSRNRFALEVHNHDSEMPSTFFFMYSSFHFLVTPSSEPQPIFFIQDTQTIKPHSSLLKSGSVSLLSPLQTSSEHQQHNIKGNSDLTQQGGTQFSLQQEQNHNSPQCRLLIAQHAARKIILVTATPVVAAARRKSQLAQDELVDQVFAFFPFSVAKWDRWIRDVAG